MSYKDIREILAKANELLQKLTQQSDQLDELQKAQVIQSLIQAKTTLVNQIQAIKIKPNQQDNYDQLVKEVADLDKSIQNQAEKLNLPKVQKALTYLEEGVSELIQRKQKGETVVKE